MGSASSFFREVIMETFPKNPAQSRHLSKTLRRRQSNDRSAAKGFLYISAFPLLLILMILIALIFRSWPILESKSVWDLLTGQVWKPVQGLFGFYPFIIGTIWVTVVAMILAVPPCLLVAIYLVEYAHTPLKNGNETLLDLLASIPSVVYGVWGLVAIVPWVQRLISSIHESLAWVHPLVSIEQPDWFQHHLREHRAGGDGRALYHRCDLRSDAHRAGRFAACLAGDGRYPLADRPSCRSATDASGHCGRDCIGRLHAPWVRPWRC